MVAVKKLDIQQFKELKPIVLDTCDQDISNKA